MTEKEFKTLITDLETSREEYGRNCVALKKRLYNLVGKAKAGTLTAADRTEIDDLWKLSQIVIP